MVIYPKDKEEIEKQIIKLCFSCIQKVVLLEIKK